MEKIDLNINGEICSVDVEKNQTLLWVLREKLDLTGSKCGCGTGDCGACKVLLDGQAVNSCTIPAYKAAGHKITTIEGVANKDGTLHPIQQAMIECGAVQCGYCIPGMVISSLALLNRTLEPADEDITQAISNNLCRCTGYVKIKEAIHVAAKRMRDAK